MDKKRVVHVIHWTKSGIVTLVRDMLPLYDHKQFDQHVVLFEDDPETLAQFQKIASSCHSLSFSLSSSAGIFRYFKLLRHIRPDILHTHSFLPSFLGYLFYKRCPHIVTVHNAYPYFTETGIRNRFKRWLTKKIYDSKRTRIIAVSHDVKRLLKPILSTKKQIQVIENGIKIDKYNEINVKNDQTDGKFNHIISVGRLSTQKAFDILLRAFHVVLQEKPFLQLTIVGDGPQKNTLLALSKKLGIEENVHFTGWVDDPFTLLLKRDYLYVCSSKYEGFGLSVAEAMAIGHPVISTDISGITTFVKNNQTGFLVEPGNPEKLANKILQILEKDQLRSEVSTKGRQYILDHFNLAKTVSLYEETYLNELI